MKSSRRTAPGVQVGLIVGLVLVAAAQTKGGSPERDVSWFLRRMRTLDHLPELENSHTAMSSTWDRSGGNVDGTDFKNLIEASAGSPGRNVLLDVAGPGCIHRIFVGRLGPQQAGTRIQVFLDRQEKPVFDVPILKFFDDEYGPFPYPLVFHKSYPGTLFPIPFEKHCLVQLVNDSFGNPDWNNASWSNYWQITYTRYPASVRVKSLDWPLGNEEEHEAQRTARAWLQAESGPPAEPAKWTIPRQSALKSNETVQIKFYGAGIIRQMRIGVEPPTPELLSSLRMQITWDGTDRPSVDVPVGFFFGNAFSGQEKTLTSHAAVLGKRRLDSRLPVTYPTDFHSLIMGLTGTDAYCRFPMPFSKGATLTLQNRSSVDVEALRVRLDVKSLDRVPADWGRFHATWTQSAAATDNTPRFGPQKVPVKVVLQKQARGKYVGVMLVVDWPHEYWWGEGDWLIWTDRDQWPPSYHGTGSEEYFNSGWCRFDRKAVSGFATLRPGHPTVYSFHLNDAFQFQRKIRVAEEQMGLGEGGRLIHQDHPIWSSTAYWYALPAQPADSN